MFILARIRVPAEIMGWVLVLGAPLAALGFVFAIGEPIAKFFTRNMTDEEGKKHISTRIVNWLALIVAVVVILVFSLPAFGITPLGDPFNVSTM